MNRRLSSSYRAFILLVLIATLSWVNNSAIGAETNVIVFLTDDQGWGDLGCYGHPRIQSPNIDRFATEGMRLTQSFLYLMR